MIRNKRPEADLKRSYGLWMAGAIGISAVLNGAFLWLVPGFDFSGSERAQQPRSDIVLEYIPPTQQRLVPPAQVLQPSDRGAVVPQQVILLVEPEPEDLEVGDFPLLEEEEVVEWWQVEKAPVIARRVAPVYPELARQAQLEGRVLARVLVDSSGAVDRLGSLEGHTAFHQAVRQACLQWRFHPAIQNETPVRVWVTVPFVFTLE